MDSENWETNNKTLVSGSRILSVYKLSSFYEDGTKEVDGMDQIWIITNAERSRTNILQPQEYRD